MRLAELRYLQKKYFLDEGQNELESWALIGLHLASKEKDDAISILKEEKGLTRDPRGRPKIKNNSLDYKRAVWRLFIDVYKMNKEGEKFRAGETYDMKSFLITDLLKAYEHAFNNPEQHPYLWIFERLEHRLKLRNRAMSSLLTSFHRGENERKVLWDSQQSGLSAIPLEL